MSNKKYFRAMRILHLAPHPDDEAIGAPAMLMALKAEGHKIDNLALSLGHAEQKRREREARLSCERLGFNLLLPDPLPRINDIQTHQDFLLGERDVLQTLFQVVTDYDLVVSPSHFDIHPAHEIVARALRRVLPEDTLWWQWGIWADLPFPSLLFAFGQREMKALEYALSAHVGELKRNNYMRLLHARAEIIAVLAPEKVFTFGGSGISAPYAEVVSSLKRIGDRWILSQPQIFAPEDPEIFFVAGRDITQWIESDSPRYQMFLADL